MVTVRERQGQPRANGVRQAAAVSPRRPPWWRPWWWEGVRRRAARAAQAARCPPRRRCGQVRCPAGGGRSSPDHPGPRLRRAGSGRGQAAWGRAPGCNPGRRSGLQPYGCVVRSALVVNVHGDLKSAPRHAYGSCGESGIAVAGQGQENHGGEDRQRGHDLCPERAAAREEARSSWGTVKRRHGLWIPCRWEMAARRQAEGRPCEAAFLGRASRVSLRRPKDSVAQDTTTSHRPLKAWQLTWLALKNRETAGLIHHTTDNGLTCGYA